MADTYTQLYVHIIFSVKNRERIIPASKKSEIFQYISGIIKNKDLVPIAVNGTQDHLHILLGFRPDVPISKVVQEIKNNSSKQINLNKWVKGRFQWQKGYAAFSCSKSQLRIISNYIRNQENHHRKKSFQDEYIQILNNHKIRFDEKYVFDFREETKD
jgi:REP element-mobilizing transposase RayT